MVQVCVVNGYSTAQVAGLLKIGRQTLHRWIKEKPFLAPQKITVGGVVVRLWNNRDVERVRKYKETNYCKGRGRKKAQKKSGNR